MTRPRPFTLVAAAIFAIMALAHLYRIVVGFDVTVGGAGVPTAVSWVGLVIAALLSAMLLREARG